MRTTGTPLHLRLAAVVAALPLLAGLAACSSGGTGSASCAAVVVYDGHTYYGNGGIERDPQRTGRFMPAVVPGCDDTGGRSRAEQDERVRVYELADVAPSTAVYFDGAVYVRDGRQLPQRSRRWFGGTRCLTRGTFEVTGDWIGVSGPREPRFDGDLRPPYRLQVHVTSGPSRYVGATIAVRATSATRPALTAADATASLWSAGQVTASLRCTHRRFEASGLRS